MRETPDITTISILVFVAFWVLAVGVAYAAGRRWARAHTWWRQMAAQWRAALALALTFATSLVIGHFDAGSLAGGVLWGAAIFCQALFGFALARGIGKFEPLPVVRATRRREHIWRQAGLMLLVALLVVPGTIVASVVGTVISQGFFHEAYRTVASTSLIPSNRWLTFFSLLAGAGIAEETLFRLVALSLIWRLSGSRWLAILLSAALFGAYHLSPIDSFYLTFWQFPLRQFFSSMLAGVLLGYVYVKRGYETAVLGHTLSDWIPLLLAA